MTHYIYIKLTLHFSKNSIEPNENPTSIVTILLFCIPWALVFVLIVVVIVLLISRKKTPSQTNETEDAEPEYINQNQNPDEPYGQIFLNMPDSVAPIYVNKEPLYQNANAQAMAQKDDEQRCDGIYVSQEEVELNVLRYEAQNNQPYDRLTFKED